jgi:hypothetical protein
MASTMIDTSAAAVFVAVAPDVVSPIHDAFERRSDQVWYGQQ